MMVVKSMFGRDAGTLADAVGTAVAIHVTTPNMVSCTLNGTAGPVGAITSLSVAGLVAKSMASLMTLKGKFKGIKGRDAASLFEAMSSGIALKLQMMVLSGTCAGCALGTGTGKFTALNAKILSSLILANAMGRSLQGRDIGALADCIAHGVVQHLKSSVTFSVAVSGAVSPTPPTGPVAVVGVPSLLTKVS